MNFCDAARADIYLFAMSLNTSRIALKMLVMAAFSQCIIFGLIGASLYVTAEGALVVMMHSKASYAYFRTAVACP